MKSLYKTPLCELELFDVSERLNQYKRQLQKELLDRGIRFDFHIWVSTDWFCPDGVPGFAVPFYLFHPDLMTLHKKEVGQVEGRTEREILMLMRHELGHAIDNAFRLRKKRRRQLIFGSSHTRYPESYKPRENSKNFVQYLGDDYAQSHPDEDFAETFAYWLDPSKNWRQKKHGFQARKKLEFMQDLMTHVRRRRPLLKNQNRVEPLEKLKLTLKEHYKNIKNKKQLRVFHRIDSSIEKQFEKRVTRTPSEPLAQYLRQCKRQMSRAICQSEGVYLYEAERGLNLLIQRAQKRKTMASRADLKSRSPLWIQQSFRYLKQEDQLKYYL